MENVAEQSTKVGGVSGSCWSIVVRGYVCDDCNANDDNGNGDDIPHICHFFYTGRIFENQILHPKKRLKAPKALKMSLKKSNICIFFTQSGKIYTGFVNVHIAIHDTDTKQQY